MFLNEQSLASTQSLATPSLTSASLVPTTSASLMPNQADFEEAKKIANQRSIQCDSALQKKEKDAVLHGTSDASKVVLVGGCFKISELEAGVCYTPKLSDITDTFMVHGRCGESRNDRVGDVTAVNVTEVTLFATNNNHTVPVAVSTPSLRGKITPLLNDASARSNGPAARKLTIVGTNSQVFPKGITLYRSMRRDIIAESKVTNSFDVDELTKECTNLTRPGLPPATLVPEQSYIVKFIDAHAVRWKQTIKFPLMEGFYMYPKSLVTYALMLLRAMQDHVAAKTHNFGEFTLHFQSVCAGGSPAAIFCRDSEFVTVTLELLVRYTFLDENKLKKAPVLAITRT